MYIYICIFKKSIVSFYSTILTRSFKMLKMKFYYFSSFYQEALFEYSICEIHIYYIFMFDLYIQLRLSVFGYIIN